MWLAVNHNRRISVLHGQVSLAAVDQICVNHEAVIGCSLKDCFNNVNIAIYLMNIYIYGYHLSGKKQTLRILIRSAMLAIPMSNYIAVLCYTQEYLKSLLKAA